MASNMAAGAPSARAGQSGSANLGPLLGSALGYGVVVGAFYLALGLAQALTRDGFEFKRHALSHLANGPGGWVQTANFVLSGAMVIVAAFGIARALGANTRAVSWLLGVFGVSMLVAAMFPADPVYGLPAGTSMADPTSITTTGTVHFIAGALGFTCLGVSCLFGARAMSRRNERALSRFSLVCGLCVLFGFFGGGAFSQNSAGIAGIWFSVIVGWTWLAIISLHLFRTQKPA